jgi:hypothetical protein
MNEHSSVASIWKELKPRHGEGDGFVRLRIPGVSSCATYAGRRILDGQEALILEFSTKSLSSHDPTPRAAGFEVYSHPITPGRTGTTRLLLVLQDSQFRDVFYALADDVVRTIARVATEPEALRAFSDRLHRWQAFLRRHGGGGLTLERRRGLFGELLFLRDEILPRVGEHRAVSSWKGSGGAHHDFQLRSGSVEVKTTAAASPHAFHVSNILQVEPAGDAPLGVVLVMLEETEGGSESLPDLIASIRGVLSTGPLELFNTALVDSGYLDVQEDEYQTPRYNRRQVRSFEVREGFPRLSSGALPNGVEDVRYSVALAACSPFECKLGELLAKITE